MNENTLLYICRGAVLLLLLPIHELSHGLMARKLGDPTAENAGRISLNPFVHLDLLGSGLLLFAGVGWAKPVPVNPGYFKNPKQGMALTALAGPVSNLLVSLVLVVLMRFIYIWADLSGTSSMMPVYLYIFLQITAQISVNLAIFNMLPVPPLDGSRLVAAVLPDKWLQIYYSNTRAVSLVFMAVLIFTNVLDGFLYTASDFVMNGLYAMTAFLG